MTEIVDPNTLYEDKLIVPEIIVRTPRHFSIIFDSGVRIDIYPKNKRWHFISSERNQRGSYNDLKVFLDRVYDRFQVEK